MTPIDERKDENLNPLMKRMRIYSNIYIKNYGNYPSNFNVHHIDINRNNNSLVNLIAIPIELHEKYHQQEKYMINCYKLNNLVGYKYHRDQLIENYYKMKDYEPNR